MPYTYTELQNMITEDLRENLEVSPHEVADIMEYMSNLMQGAEMTQEYAGLLTPSSTDPAVSGYIMLGIATEAGTYGNLAGSPEVIGKVAFLHYNGTSWQVVELFDVMQTRLFPFTNKNVVNVAHGKYKHVPFTVWRTIDAANNEYEIGIPDRVVKREMDMDIYLYPKVTGFVEIY